MTQQKYCVCEKPKKCEVYHCGFNGNGEHCENCGLPIRPSVEPSWEKEFDEEFAVLDTPDGSEYFKGGVPPWPKKIKSFISSLLLSERQKEREETLLRLVPWIDENVGSSSTALFLYMTANSLPHSFEAPSDRGDRARCIALLRAFPEWIERLDELSGQGRWSEQIPLIKEEMTLPYQPR